MMHWGQGTGLSNVVIGQTGGAENVTLTGGQLPTHTHNATFTSTLGQFGPNRTLLGGTTPYNFAPTNYYQRPDERYTLGAFANYEISPALQPYLEGVPERVTDEVDRHDADHDDECGRQKQPRRVIHETPGF